MEQLLNDLIKYFLEEKDHPVIEVPKTYVHKREFLRGLLNVREAKPLPQNIIEKENELLKLELQDRKIKNINDFDNKFNLWQGDITQIKCDAIVNPAEEDLLGCFKPNHNCIDNKVHTYAGVSLRLKLREITRGEKIETSKVILTDGFNLPCNYIVHAVKPIISEITKDIKEEIQDFYINSLELAKKNNIKTICLPNLSVFDSKLKEKIASITVHTLKKYLKNDNYFDKVVLNVFTLEEYNIYNKALK